MTSNSQLNLVNSNLIHNHNEKVITELPADLF